MHSAAQAASESSVAQTSGTGRTSSAMLSYISRNLSERRFTTGSLRVSAMQACARRREEMRMTTSADMAPQIATIFGAVTMLPGGLGVTEGSMTGLLVLLGKMQKAPAFAATMLVRVCTLWFGVTIGVVAFVRWRRKQPAVGVALQEKPPETAGS